MYEQKFPTDDLELATVVFVLKIWRNYKYEVYCDIFIEYHSLQYIMN